MAGEADESILKLALAMHSNPGVYALLLGSGVSRGAGIPTGWEIVTDLITKVAAVDGAAAPSDPEAWFKERFGKPPSYTSVLEMLAGTPAERRGLLRGYFEPTEEEQEQGLKLPTLAHTAIARLVELGYVRVILTTNFDRLIEKALADAGIAPEIVSSNDDLRGAVPLVHSDCLVVKIHGDYLDARIRNTEKELAKYPKRLDEFLDRVFDEFGLIVCGWSAEWDTALSSAIVRCPTRRFTSYWLARGALGEEAENLVAKRKAVTIPITDADGVFTELVEKTEALTSLGGVHPISADVALATVKKYLPEERHRIRLNDLFAEETNRVWESITSDRFESHVAPEMNEGDDFRQRMGLYEAALGSLLSMVTALSYHDDGRNTHLLTRTLEHLVAGEGGSGSMSLLDLRNYPALLCLYAAGTAAVAGLRFDSLRATLLTPRVQNRRGVRSEAVVRSANTTSVFSHTQRWIERPIEREHTPASNHILEFQRGLLRDYVPDDAEYEEVFDVFEYLLCLTFLDLAPEDQGYSSWAPSARYEWHQSDRWSDSRPVQFTSRSSIGHRDELLGAGLFGGEEGRLEHAITSLDELLSTSRARHF